MNGASATRVRLRRCFCHVLALLVLCPPAAYAQYPPPQPSLQAPSPLLYVRMSGPAGMRVTLYRGGAIQSLAAPCTVGLRPGYIYRVAVSGMPGYPGQTFYPTLEVRGTLQLPGKLRCADFPVPLVFNDTDFRALAGGALVTRILLLERPDGAIPEATRPNQPIELTASTDREAEAMAQDRGRALVVVRVGQRQWGAEELAAQGIPGTILCPGDPSLGPARDLPCLRWACVPAYESALGQLTPPEEVCIPDGGDFGLQAGFDRQGRLRGLDPGDTVAQYADSTGRRHIAVSNRVCVCVPRYLVIRTEVMPAGEVALVGPFNARVANGYSLLLSRVPPLEQEQVEVPAGMTARQRLSASLHVTGPMVVGRVQGAMVVSTEEGPGEVTGSCAKPKLAPERPLLIIKWPDKCGAQIGEVVTFFLKYSNQGGQPISDIVVSDSLAGRFEYVPNSAKSDRDAVFTILPNEAGSLIVRWEVASALPPGKSGMVSFQVRIR